MKWMIAAVLLLAPAALANDQEKQCKKDCKDFVAVCQNSCEQNVDKKNRNALQGCKKNCQDFEKECAKECANEAKQR